eukprot:TRINITY_DN16613_c0_g1_i1.p1 TRINITY_DN16613_c0_g1~~TRINITY_DN16613_c0_g1_i1.p1  ORF type:complete len:863 (+),score=149.02 TRINITY_DN16613_c0_g1_i1:83-2671(+)
MGLLGIQSLTVTLAVSILLATCAIMGGIAISTGESSTTDARETGDRGVEHCLDSAWLNIKNVTSLLLYSSLGELKLQIIELIATPNEAGDRFAKFSSLVHPDIFGRPDFGETILYPKLFSEFQHILDVQSNIEEFTANIFVDDFSPNSDTLRQQFNDSWGMRVSLFETGMHPNGTASYGAVLTRKFYPDGPFGKNNDNLSHFGNVDSQGKLIDGPCQPTNMLQLGLCTIDLQRERAPARIEHENRCYYNAFSSDSTLTVSDPDKALYSPITTSGPFLMMQACRPLANEFQVNKAPRQGNRVGYVMSSVSTKGISRTMKEADLPNGTVIYAIEKNPFTGEVSTLAGCNVGESLTLIPQYVNGTRSWDIAFEIPAVNHTINDELSPIAYHSRHILNNMSANIDYYEVLSQLPAGTVEEWTDPVTLIVYWSSVAKIEYLNVNWYLVVLVSRDTVTKGIGDAEKIIRSDLAAEKKKTDDERNRKYMIMYVVTTVCVAVLVVLAVVLTKVIVAPLRVLMDEMAAVALLQTDAVDLTSPLSALSEVREMQKSFREMVKNIVEYRNYMPQSVLIQSSDNSSEENTSRGDTDTVITASSRLSYSSSTRLGAAQYQHATEIGIRNRVVTVIMFNSIGWHAHSERPADGDGETTIERHRMLIEALTHSVDINKGICDAFTGDRLMAYFNAIRNTGEHKAGAVKAAVMARTKCHIPISFAVTSGTAKVGNIGITGMKKYSVLSTVVPFAASLERLNSMKGYEGLIDSRCFEYSNLVVNSRAVTFVVFKKRTSNPCLIYEALTMRDLEEQEWMYQIATDGIYSKWNAAVLNMTNGNFEAAEDLLDTDTNQHDDRVTEFWREALSRKFVSPVEIF